MILISVYFVKRSNSDQQRRRRVVEGEFSTHHLVDFIFIPGRLEAINFYLLHLSLMREYLDLEFHDIARLLPFQYNLERVIDDFILLAVFIGNDFLPHLPDLHINENGLERLFDVYMKTLPSLGKVLWSQLICVTC